MTVDAYDVIRREVHVRIDRRRLRPDVDLEAVRNEVSTTVDIRKPRADRTVCTVRATNFYSEIVGSTDIAVPAGIDGRLVTVSFPTSDKAVVVDVYRCVSTRAP